MFTRFIAALGAASLALISPLAASAQDVPSYAQADAPAPQYADAGTPSYATQDQQIHGRVVSFDGGYSLQVRDDQGYIDNVQLHQGTIINPTGLTLASGMVVSVNGFNQGSFFAANEIDTPYTYYGGVPYYGGYPWYHYGPDISFGFFFGNTGWWHGGYYGNPGYFRGGIRVYNVGLYYTNGGGIWNGHGYAPGGYHGSVGYRGPLGAPGNGYRSPQGAPGYGYRAPQGSAGYRSTQSYPGYRAPQGGARGPAGNPGAYGHGAAPAARGPVSSGHSGGGDHHH